MRAVGAVCENGNAVASLCENGDDIYDNIPAKHLLLRKICLCTSERSERAS